MADIITAGTTKFPKKLVTELIDRVKGKSSLASLANSEPIPFNGTEQFTFSMDDEVDLVAESGKKSRGSVTLEPVTIVPYKVEYGARLSQEFMYASEEAQIEMLKSFSDGFAKKTARGIDIMAFHGINPRNKEASSLIGENNFDGKVTQVAYSTEGATADAKIEAAIALVQAAEEDVTGMAMSPSLRSALAAMTKQDGSRVFPELAWGSAPGVINGLPVEVNSTVSFNGSDDLAVLGNFRDYFKWGYAKEVPLKVIEYGDPDNTGRDLQGHNEIYIRCEAFIGWGIINPDAFARISSKASPEG